MDILNPIFFIISSLNLGSFFFPYRVEKKSIPILLAISFFVSVISNNGLAKILILLFTLMILLLSDAFSIVVNFFSGFLLYSFIVLSYFYLLNVFNLKSLLNSSSPWFLLFFVCNCFTFIVRRILKTKLSASLFKNEGKNVYYIFLVDLLLLGILYLFFSNVYTSLVHTLLAENPLFLSGLFLLIGIILCILFVSFYKIKLNAKIAKQTHEQQELLHAYVHEIKAQKHDFNSNLTTLQHLVLTKKYEQLAQFLDALLDENDMMNQTMMTSIPELSALLFQYEKKAKKENVILSLYIETKIEDSPISLYKLNKMLGNILSNAIEAASMTHEKKVSLTIKKINQTLFFIVENSGKINEDIQNYMFQPNQTSKNRKEDHGYGLYIVNNIVNEMNGTIDFSQTNQSVLCTIGIPLE